MPKNPLKLAVLLLAAPAAAAAGLWDTQTHRSIRTGTIEVTSPVTGISTAQETFEVFAPYDGRIEEVQSELFSFATPKTVLARMVSTEMAALLDSTSARKQTERRWQDVYDYTDIKPEEQGVITNVYIQPGTRVSKGDRLFTVARKVVIVAKNTEPLYSEPTEDIQADLVHTRTEIKFKTRLINFLKVKNTDRIYRLWLLVEDLREGIKIGEQFDGTLHVGKSTNAMLVPRSHVVDSGGRRFLITEIKTGLETAEETEILGHSSIYMEPPAEPGAKKEDSDGKNKKVR